MFCFYDIEVFPKYWCVVILEDEDLQDDTKKVKHVFEDIESLRNYYKAHRSDEFTWVGYNSMNYDAPMLRFIMLGLDPYECSQELIVYEKKWWQFPFDIKSSYQKIPLKNFDCMVGRYGLKKMEAFMGSSIVETSIPFDYEGELTREQKDEIVSYCFHDVKETRKVFKKTIKEYHAHEGLIESFDLRPSDFSKTQAQLSAIILNAKPQKRFDEWEFEIPDTLKIEKYQEIVEWYRNGENHDYKKKLTIMVADVEHIFAWGGLHGAKKKYHEKGIFVLSDITSMYPSIMIEYNFLSRNVLSPEKYKEIRDYRLILKKVKDPKQEPYKRVLNGTFGASKDKYNALYDPRQANSICVSGQLLILDLIEKVENCVELIQTNTDGILVKCRDEENVQQYLNICKDWETRVRLDLEHSRFKEVFQKDVNNYLVVPEGELFDEKGKPQWKSKGAWVKELSDIDYDLPIVNKALVQYMLHGTPVEETITNCNELREFQKICSVSRKYKYGLHGDQPINEKYIRVFASTNPEHGGIFKLHAVTENIAKVADTPKHAFIENGKVLGVSIDGYPLDKQYYIDMAKKRLKNFVN